MLKFKDPDGVFITYPGMEQIGCIATSRRATDKLHKLLVKQFPNEKFLMDGEDLYRKVMEDG